MRHFAAELSDQGFVVDYRHADSLVDGLRAHRAQYDPTSVSVTHPSSHGTWRALKAEGVELLRNVK